MAVKVFTLADGGVEEFGPWFAEQTLAGVGAGDWYIVPRTAQSILVAITPVVAGEGKIQYTLDSAEAIGAGTATAADWDAGQVASYTDDVFYPVAAIRLYCASGSVRLMARAR